MTIAVDFDGTLAKYHKGQFPEIGVPIWPMWNRVSAWLEAGEKVVIFTARIHKDPDQYHNIQKWLSLNGLPQLEITNVKTPDISAFYDDRAYHVIPNTGEIVCPP